MGNEFLPLLFAADINVYSVARAFHEKYGIKSTVYGRAAGGPCADSAIIDYSSVSDADSPDTLLRLVNSFAAAHKDTKILVIGCGDSYVRSICERKREFADNVIAPYAEFALIDELTNKETFYALCEREGIDYPDTFIHKSDMAYDIELPFGEPFIIKPSNGVMYWSFPFEGQDKVFKADTRAEAADILRRIYASGYTDSVVIQNFIPGDDSYMRVLTCYSDRKARARVTCLGHVLLEEHTPHGIGNHAVIITEHNEELSRRFRRLLDSVGYTGFSNFDIKYDVRDGKYKVFELNARQGRSNYYVTGAGVNVAELVVMDRIMGSDVPDRDVREESLWMVVPRGVALKNIDGKYAADIDRLIKEGRYTSPLLYKADRVLKHRLKVLRSRLQYRAKFKKYYQRNETGNA
jgi:D-aspartate ligase